jgi:hypothetical protein
MGKASRNRKEKKKELRHQPLEDQIKDDWTNKKKKQANKEEEASDEEFEGTSVKTNCVMN